MNIPDDVIDFTPELRAQALKQLERYKPGPLFTPPILGNINGLLGSLNVGNLGGGTNWPGGGYDPETHIVYAPASNSGIGSHSLVDASAGILRYPIRARRQRPAVRRGVRAGRLLRGGLTARDRAGGSRGKSGRSISTSGCSARSRGRNHTGGQPWRVHRGRAADAQAALRRARRRFISIAASCSGRCRTATRRTSSAIIRR